MDGVQDPENLFKGTAPQEGLIERRLMHQRIQQDQEFAARIEVEKDNQKALIESRRAGRTPPEGDPVALVEYLLNTEAADMEFEVARCRPLLDEAFFQELDQTLGRERFNLQPDEERVAELDALREYLRAMVEAVDKVTETYKTSAKERLTKLLSAPDKKAMILEMVANSEIDRPLVQLLDENILAAKMAKQDDAVAFMEKIRRACMRYMADHLAESSPAPPPPQATREPSGASGDKPGLIL